jgi:hypothetical protein
LIQSVRGGCISRRSRQVENAPGPRHIIRLAHSRINTMATVSLKKTLPAARPFRAAQESELQTQFRRALTTHDGVAGAHCIHEWWMRNAFPTHIEAALAQLWQHAAKSIPDWLPMHYVSWLPLVYEVAASFKPAKRGRRNIYLVRLDYSDRGADLQGIYVGMTAYPPAQRFDQHRAGIRAAGSILKRGQELLIGPVLHLQHITQPDAVHIERDLAIALADAGLLVEGGH